MGGEKEKAAKILRAKKKGKKERMILEALIDTLIMVSASTLIGLTIGSLIGSVLFITGGILKPHPTLYRILDIIINSVRSLPYLILMISIIPLTRFITGSAIGLAAAIVPLTIASIFLWSRIVQETLNGLPAALTEMGIVMGLSTCNIIRHILWPEALPTLIRNGALMVIQLIGFSAMAGTVGGGGLGDIAIRYGYQRYDTMLMIYVVLVLITLVQTVQWGSNLWGKQCRQS